MSKTPGRRNDHDCDEKLTPVRFLDSPRVKSNSNDDNFSAIKARIEVIIPLLQSNYTKWQLAQKRGTTICTSIEAIKVGALQNRDPKTSTLYPKDLRPYVDKLIVIVSIFEDITKSAFDSLWQLKALGKLAGVADIVFYRSWQISQYINFLDELSASYNQETKVKQYVARELPHCLSRADLIRCTTAWEYPQFVDEWTSLSFLFLNEEDRCRNKT
ncbi:uncharacterized protein [Eurosta solidaginis]|uniref:uncharacterized protein n=1 Tax=Eurosta solidaginis TaxID=178769 RepID=UPI00353164BC